MNYHKSTLPIDARCPFSKSETWENLPRFPRCSFYVPITKPLFWGKSHDFDDTSSRQNQFSRQSQEIWMHFEIFHLWPERHRQTDVSIVSRMVAVLHCHMLRVRQAPKCGKCRQRKRMERKLSANTLIWQNRRQHFRSWFHLFGRGLVDVILICILQFYV